MSSTSLQQDPCSYQEKLKRSIGPGMYMLGTPANDCDECGKDIPNDPFLRWQSWGPGFCEFGSTVDVGSELRGLNYKATKCAQNQYLPGRYTPAKEGICNAKGQQDPRKCMAPTEATRLSNPPCTLRSTGWNRWEWLCYDPQDKAIIPFEWNTSYRIIAKDNHTACIPKPEDQTNEVAASKADPLKTLSGWTPPPGCGAEAPGNANAAVSYRSCGNVKSVNGM